MLPWNWVDELSWFSSGVTELLVDSPRMINKYSECFVNSMQVTHGRFPPPHPTMQWDGGCNTHIWVIDDLRDALHLHPWCCDGENRVALKGGLFLAQGHWLPWSSLWLL